MPNIKSNVIITGAAGFIGFFLAKKLLEEGYHVTGVDNMNDYYDIALKNKRLSLLLEYPEFTFKMLDISNRDALFDALDNLKAEVVVNLAAQPGVRYSLINPNAYVDSNITGFVNILEYCRYNGVSHLVFASSSSVYGANRKMPYSVRDIAEHPVSLYGATKKSNELLAHTYSHLFGLPATGLRFFTVYGPYGRPDMAYFLFTKAIMEDKPIRIFNHGNMKRDFTYIDDIVDGVYHVMLKPPKGNPDWSEGDLGSSYAPFKVYNIGNNKPVELMEFVGIIEEKLGKKAIKEFYDLQPGDVLETYADIDDLIRDTGFMPSTDLEKGLERFISWYLSYYG